MIFTLACAAAGCGNANFTPHVPADGQFSSAAAATPTENLAGKSLTQVLQLKYNQAVFRCSLWTQQSKQLDISGEPVDAFALDLKGPLNLPQTLTLKGSIPNHEVELVVKVNAIGLYQNMRYRDDSGTVYQFSYSPYVNASISYKTSSLLGGQTDGPAVSNGSGSPRDIDERVKEIALDSSVAPEPATQNGAGIDQGSFRDYAECYVDTDIRKGYQGQFQIEHN